ncbi:hypothetical protein HWV07_18775 [Natronomonas salina]|uniref:hypothetical protein n=1 Tax=Natronomonas salina TaxID=1710540 RepID=UPI0015B6C50E|nr:hypothetical protein [Natronomonas salina]QLD90979.1 hypothetical protein HWV07_18775 [Natronomonas salina]
MSDDFETELADAFESEYGADADVAGEAASRAAAFREDWDEELSVEAFLEELDDAPYDEFEHRFDAAVGELAAAAADCTDSREYRLAGYDDFGADPSIGA